MGSSKSQLCRSSTGSFMLGGVDGKAELSDPMIPLVMLVSDIRGNHGFDVSIGSFCQIGLRMVTCSELLCHSPGLTEVSHFIPSELGPRSDTSF